ncbi:MAG: metallophosphoesterase family protein [Ktedonobacteraceae bacterium]|nr:metallophosphoesterase family protein [Ktedonobacteraceae bacterium]
MRIAVLADIHGNLLALEAVLQDLAQQPYIDLTVVAGDLCLNGPRPKEVLELVQALDCPVVCGNTDVEIVSEAPEKSAKKQSVVAWTREQIGSKGIDYLASLPFSHLATHPDRTDVLVVHANPLNLEDHIAPDAPDSLLEHLLGGLESSSGALAFGHLHIAYQRRWRHLLLVDAGSCGMPRDQDLRAAYAILTWRDHTWQAEHRRVEYDVNEVVKQLKTSGIPSVEKRIKVLTEAKY